MRLDDPILSGSVTFITGGLMNFGPTEVANLDLTANESTHVIPASTISGSYDPTHVVPASILSGSLSADVSVESASYAVTAAFALNAGAGGGGAVSETQTYTASFTDATSVVLNHNFNSQNIIVSVYDNNSPPLQILPHEVELTSNNQTTVIFNATASGHAVVALGGHLVSGSLLVSDATQTVTASYTNETSIDVEHNFDSQDVIVSVYSGSNPARQVIPEEITLTDNNNINVTFPQTQSGHIVVVRGGHLVGGSSTFTYSQTLTGNSEYTIVHNLSYNYPIVQFWDTTTDEQVIPDVVRRIDNNTISASFQGIEFNGHVVVKK